MGWDGMIYFRGEIRSMVTYLDCGTVNTLVMFLMLYGFEFWVVEVLEASLSFSRVVRSILP